MTAAKKDEKRGRPSVPKDTSQPAHLPASAEPGAAPPVALNANLPVGIKVRRNVVLPVLNLRVNETRYLCIASPMRVSDYKDPDPKKATEKPATICEVGDVETGEQFLLLVPEVMSQNIKRAYPDGDYVGKAFALLKCPKRPGKRYFDFQISEIEVDVAAMQSARAALAAPEAAAAGS